MKLIEAAISLLAVNIHLGVVVRRGISFVVQKVTRISAVTVVDV